MSNPWYFDYLQIEPTSDQRQIKKAYARLLKTFDPEQEPARFERLRQAYESALTWTADLATDLSVDLDDVSPAIPQDQDQQLTALDRVDASDHDCAPPTTPTPPTLILPLLSPSLIRETHHVLRECPEQLCTHIDISINTLSFQQLELFEFFLQRLLWRSDVPNRLALYEACLKTFDWSLIRIKDSSLDHWQRLTCQHEQLLALSAHRQLVFNNLIHRLNAFEQADFLPSGMPMYDLYEFHRQFPDWLKLHLNTRRITQIEQALAQAHYTPPIKDNSHQLMIGMVFFVLLSTIFFLVKCQVNQAIAYGSQTFMTRATTTTPDTVRLSIQDCEGFADLERRHATFLSQKALKFLKQTQVDCFEHTFGAKSAPIDIACSELENLIDELKQAQRTQHLGILDPYLSICFGSSQPI